MLWAILTDEILSLAAKFKIIAIFGLDGFMMITTLLDELNERQREAVTAPLGNILVLAGAGSGKTQVLVKRIAWLINQQYLSPRAILAVTFTNKAAREILARLNNMLKTPAVGLWVGTFHGLCHRLLRHHYQEAKLPEQFLILDSDDQARVIKRVLASLKLDETTWPVKQAQSFINSKKDEGLRPQHINVISHGPTPTLLQIYKAYEQACQTAGVIDFAELLLRTFELLRDNKELLVHYHQRFHAILVDEFQDTNAIQYAWIRLLAGIQTSVMVVGDDDQAIYGWRGAKVENIQRFAKEFQNTQIVKLEQNYRSTSTILEAARAVISNNDSRMDKLLWTDGATGEKLIVYNAYNELEEARFVSDYIKLEINRGRNADDIAVLYRSNAQSRVLEEALMRTGIDYRIQDGLRFFERAEIKDTLAYLRLLVNPDDDYAFERVVNFPTRGIGEKTLDATRHFAKTNQLSLWQAAKAMCQGELLSPRTATVLGQFIELIEKLQLQTANMELDKQIETVIELSGLYAHFTKVKGDKSESRIGNLQELVNAAKEFPNEQNSEEKSPLLSAFLAHASLEVGDRQTAEHKRCVQLMTLHSAKGLEFPLVFLVGMEEGVFPGKQSLGSPARLEEERRLCYVGMTRAMEKLVLTYAKVRRQYGYEETHRPSRFLCELPEKLVKGVEIQGRFQPLRLQKTVPTALQEAGLQLGQRVKHPKFGLGVVLAAEGNGAHMRVHIKFAEGNKWLVLSYANLTIIEEDYA
jgi:DNA helicase II / ATP-dependent DNA helicase PcrA